MRVYILRPYGQKEGIDFDRVEHELIQPALHHLGYSGSTAGTFVGADLRSDVFEELVTADIVVADVSVSSANLFLELGVRYALRERYTVLISTLNNLPIPWHLNALRRTIYDSSAPEKMVTALVSHIQQVVDGGRVDSPIFLAMPRLVPPPSDVLQVVPASFAQELERAAREGNAGHLALLAHEALAFPWRLEGLRRLGAAQFKQGDWVGARSSFEIIRESQPDDLDANARLATIYQRLKRPSESGAAIERLLASPRASREQRAEYLALHARNLKSEWVETWSGKSVNREVQALRSPKLPSSRDTYVRAFKEDLNHYYSGLNALALTQMRIDLAQRHPDTWTDQFDTDDDASSALVRERELAQRLAGALELALDRAREASAKDRPDRWLSIAEADAALFTGKAPRRVLRQYERALDGADPFELNAVRAQLEIHQALGVFVETVEAVLGAIGTSSRSARAFEVPTTVQRVMLFTGHMIDAAERAKPRFPASMEEDARRAIEEAVRAEGGDPASTLGIAGGSSGGDILFHEVCRKIGVRTELYLAVPEPEYLALVVAPSGRKWVERFQAVREWAPVRILQASSQLPDWLRRPSKSSVWQRNNQWILQSALAYRTGDVRLVALWNGEESDGPGGTKEMIASARAEGAAVTVLNTDAIFGVR